MDKNVLVVGGGRSYYYPFSSFGEYSSDINLFLEPDQISLVVFTGGEDINPELYKQSPCSLTRFNERRDNFEIDAFNKARKANLKMAGICRGAQFLCVMAGGSLFQHVNNHGRSHRMILWDNRVMSVSSMHHQMQNPPKDANVLGWSSPSQSTVYWGENDEKLPPPEKEAEIVHYKNIDAIGFQHHPEIMHADSPGFLICEELVKKFLG